MPNLMLRLPALGAKRGRTENALLSTLAQHGDKV